MKRSLLLAIRLYQRLLSPLLLPACRYVPTCSQYARDAVELHGPAKGALLAAGRLLRCHPLARGGYDPVPPVVKHISPRSGRNSLAHRGSGGKLEQNAGAPAARNGSN